MPPQKKKQRPIANSKSAQSVSSKMQSLADKKMQTVPKNFRENVEEESLRSNMNSKLRSKTLENADVKASAGVHDNSSNDDGYSNILSKIKRPFTRNSVNRLLEEDWYIVDTDAADMSSLRCAVDEANTLFKFSKSTTHKRLAISMFRRCQVLIEKANVLDDNVQMIMAQCEHERSTTFDSLSKLREMLFPQSSSPEQNIKRIQWTTTRLCSTLSAAASDLQERLREQDSLILECGHLLVKVMTLLHMRSHRADYSGTGVAAGAAGVVAGAVVGIAELAVSVANLVHIGRSSRADRRSRHWRPKHPCGYGW